MTQEELAKSAEVSPRTVSDLERGVNKSAQKATAGLLADGLGLAGPERERFVAAARGKLSAAEISSWVGDLLLAGGPALASAVAGEHYDDTEASSLAWIESALSRQFVGRAAELAALGEAWRDARAGRRVLVLVAGEPGIGKTALTAELARQVISDGGLVLYGRWDEEVLAPYQAFREALADYAQACPAPLLRRDLAGLAADIARLCPEPAQRIGVCAAGPLAAAEAERFRLFGSLDTWLQRMGDRHPVLLVLDDLQWADRPSLLLLSHLMQARRSAPLLTVAMYRDMELAGTELPAVLQSLGRDIDCRRLPLRGLERDTIIALLESAAGRPFAGREPGIVSDLERETGGNPFLLLGMARHLAERGAFDTPATARLGEAGADIPESVRAMVAARLGRVSGLCAEVLGIAAVIGERFDAALVASVARLADTVTLDLLEEAARAGLITEVDDEPDGWRFSHALTRRVTGDALSASRKVRLHQRIGETLQARPAVAPAELAHHFGSAAGGDAAAMAIRYERLAGERALREVAAEVAVRHFSDALGLAARLGAEAAPLRCQLLLDLAGAHDRAGEYAARDERFAEAADSARQLGSSELFARAALGYGGVLPATVHPDPRARALLEEALAWLGAGDDPARAMISARLAHWLHNARPYPERRELSDRSVSLARGTGDSQTLATVLLHRCWALDGPDDVDDAITVAGEISGIAADLDDPELTLEGLRIRLAAQFEKGEHAAAVATAREMKELAEQVQHPEFIRLGAMWDVTVANLEGRFADADELAAELGRQLARIGHQQARMIPVAQTLPWRIWQGRSAGYLPFLRQLAAAEPGNIAWPAITAWCLAEAGSRDDAASLLATLGPGTAVAADHNYAWWAVIAGFSGAAGLTGNREWAQALYDLAAPYAGHNATLGVATFLGAADHWLGVLAGVAGRHEEAIAHLEAALARHRDMGSAPLTALTQEAYGHVLSLRGQAADLERAAPLLESAARTANELGLTAITGRK
jgi:hypothetical protein